MENVIERIINYIPNHTAKCLLDFIRCNKEKLITEIRLRAERPSSFSCDGRNAVLFSSKVDVCSSEEISQTLGRLCEDSIHTYSDAIKSGYISLDGGYRVGVCGNANTENERVKGVYRVTSLNIRIPREIRGVSGDVLRVIRKNGAVDSALIYSMPGVGKTTVLRDIAVSLSTGWNAMRVCVVDNRREIYMKEAFGMSIADFLIGYPKADGIEISTRTMNPEVIICDEIGDDEVSKILAAQNCGVPLIASAHGASFDEIMRRQGIKRLYDSKVFRYYIGVERVCNTLKYTFNEVW